MTRGGRLPKNRPSRDQTSHFLKKRFNLQYQKSYKFWSIVMKTPIKLRFSPIFDHKSTQKFAIANFAMQILAFLRKIWICFALKILT